MSAESGQMTKQLTKAWSSARWPTLVTFGHVVTCLFKAIYRAKYYLTKGWSSALVICPPSWPPARLVDGRWPHGHVTQEVAK